MQDWGPRWGRRAGSDRDDPWNYAPKSSISSGAADGSPGSTPDQAGRTSGEAQSPAAERGPSGGRSSIHERRSSVRGILTLVVVALIGCAVVATLLHGSGIVLQGSYTWSESDSAEDPDSDDGFSVEIDPDEDESDDTETTDSDETGPSEVELYTGDAELTLELCSSEGLEELTYQEIYAKVSPSVVTITVYGDTSGAYATGIILSEDGFILTNQHVVALQSYAQVTTADNETYTALLVGEDANSDLALLKIEAEGLTPAEFGISDELVVGDECFAIGNPLGITYRNSFTNGIISALDRTVTVNGYTMTLLQTSAALNSGNSGGPLINIYGQVIGINNMKIISSETTVEGLGFAIPSSTAQTVINALASDGVVEHPVFGITCYAVTAGDAEGNEVSGILVVTVSTGSDAGAQGLQVGDIITALNGSPIYSVSDVDLTGMHVGDSVTVTVYRDGEHFDLTFQLVEQNDLD